ncbi:MAG: DUF805 domain-containing protein [Acidobacteriota bacterium]|nr:DUF805 domain-containing protein [Acidobacteriota bacterium]
MDWYLKPWRQYGDFSGRAQRKEYWMFALGNMIVYIALMLLISVAAAGSTDQSGDIPPLAVPPLILLAFYALATIIPNLAVSVRRMHDIGKSGWWIFISVIPFGIGAIWFLVLAVTDSQPGWNAWGESPKQAY